MASQSGVSNLNNFKFFRNLAKFNGTSGSRARRIENENSNFRKWQFQFCNFQLSNNLIMCGTSILEEIQILKFCKKRTFYALKFGIFSKSDLKLMIYDLKWSLLSKNGHFWSLGADFRWKYRISGENYRISETKSRTIKESFNLLKNLSLLKSPQIQLSKTQKSCLNQSKPFKLLCNFRFSGKSRKTEIWLESQFMVSNMNIMQNVQIFYIYLQKFHE